MSWEVMLVRLRDPNWRESPQLPDIDCLGTQQEIQEMISKVLPEMEWESEPRPSGKSEVVGTLMLSDCTLEFFGFTSDYVDAVHVEGRGSGDPMEPLRRICDEYGWSLIWLAGESGIPMWKRDL